MQKTDSASLITAIGLDASRKVSDYHVRERKKRKEEGRCIYLVPQPRGVQINSSFRRVADSTVWLGFTKFGNSTAVHRCRRGDALHG